MMELKNSLTRFWALKSFDKNSFLITFPVIDDDQIKRCQYWGEYLEDCTKLKIRPNRKEFENVYGNNNDPNGDGAA